MPKNLTKVILLFMWLAAIHCDGSDVHNESPGFFLKVTKNVPRLGRRAHSLSDFENFFLKTSKSVPRIGRSDNQVRDRDRFTFGQRLACNIRNLNKFAELPKLYSSIQPFDSKSLHHLLASDAITENDIKFISWDDFDAALENDDGLFEKLLSLANDEQSMPMLARKLSQDSFTALDSDDSADKYFYRISRGGNDKTTMSQ